MKESFAKRHSRPGPLVASCLALALAGCGGGSGGEPPAERVERTPDEPLVIAAALPTDGTNPIEPGIDNPFEVPDPDAAIPPDVTSGPDESPSEELPTHDPDGIPYCD